MLRSAASEASFSVHTGTHIDAPAHFINGGKRMIYWTPEITMGACRVLEIKNPKAITAEEVATFNIKKGERVITLQTFNISNEQKWQYQIKESELKITAH